ncbi:FtsJ domain-containing protein [Mycena sanguinolenta]|uniref:FtsJ domain-containing protein n=1 Tax=Mycena sanguinolenta TaxID=230812 RepID=A0A8H7D779_9AGAR|nr:FtsJ domain-containing protein [Mycena sanguinolenta]
MAPETPSSVSSSASPYHSRSSSSSLSIYSNDSSPFSSACPSTSPSAIEGWSDACLPRILTEELIARGAEELQTLVELRERGQKDAKDTPSYAEHEKKVAENASTRRNRYWFSKMKAVFKELDMQTACIPRKGPLKFLDLGCVPGGFDSYILSKNSSAQGLGISSEIETGGHRFLLEDRHRSRFKIYYADLTYYRLGPLPTSVAPEHKVLHALPFDTAKRFDVVLLDGHQLRKAQPSARPGNWDRLLVSQIIIGLQAAKKGATLVIKLVDAEQINTAKLVHMFDILSTSLEAFKPRSIHATRGTFYAVAKGVGEGRAAGRLPVLVDALKELWVDLTIGGVDGAGRALNGEDLDFIVSTMDMCKPKNLDRLVDLSRRVWEVQARALAGLRDPPLISAGMGGLEYSFTVAPTTARA